MRFRRRILLPIFGTLALTTAALRANDGDVESAHDYAGFPRLPGFVITDFDEDNPAEFDFPVARPLATDSAHVETEHICGHRYVIRYEAGTGVRPVTLFQTQRFYEKEAADAGFKIEKSGAVGDVTETFHRVTSDHEIWIYIEPAISVDVLTIIESGRRPPTPVPPRLATMTAAPTLNVPAVIPSPAAQQPSRDAPPPPTPAVDPKDDSLYESLTQTGRVILPFTFQPGKEELDASSQSLVDRTAAMLKRHPDLFLRIEGHTDNSGNPEDNMRLSAQRAIAVENKLIRANIDSKRLDAVGVGGLQPLADNNTADGREKNRRIEIVLWKRLPSPFHEPAPNGQNYYPNASDTSSTAGNKL
jgi:outer membrane protein OmpA-like peptidoglycan-associated protein